MALLAAARLRGGGLRLLEAAIAKSASVQPVLRAKAISAAANLASGVKAYNRALELQRVALGLYRELGDRREALTIESLGGLAMQLGDHEQARTFFEQCLEMFQTMGDVRHTAVTLDSLAALAYERGHLEGARGLYQESLSRFRELGGEADIAASLNNLATVVSKQEEYDEARVLYEESLTLFRRLGDERGVATAIVNLAVLLARARGDYDQAVALATGVWTCSPGRAPGRRSPTACGTWRRWPASKGTTWWRSTCSGRPTRSVRRWARMATAGKRCWWRSRAPGSMNRRSSWPGRGPRGGAEAGDRLRLGRRGARGASRSEARAAAGLGVHPRRAGRRGRVLAAGS